jgi:hypothetical protein
MPMKCESCRHFKNPDSTDFNRGQCESPEVTVLKYRLPIYVARNLCDEEQNGRFVYFEPIEVPEIPELPKPKFAHGRCALGEYDLR